MKKIALITAAALFNMSGCGNPGQKESSGVDLGESEDVLGSITSQTGSQAEMAGWVVAMIDKSSEVATVAEVDTAGLFTLKHLFIDRTYTMALISSAYVLRAVISHPGTSVGTIRQYFKVQSKTLPRLINKGQIVTLQSETGLKFQKDLSNDQDQDGVPDGSAFVQLTGLTDLEPRDSYDESAIEESDEEKLLLAEPKSTADIDNDGIKNVEDPDIDNDGIVNVFDWDDDGDEILDLFDQDSDGDLIVDNVQTKNDLYFPYGVEWISVKYEYEAQATGDPKKALIFTTKLRSDGDTPIAVQIRGAPSFLNSATVEKIDSEGGTTVQAWDRRLLDDGKSEDAAADDLLFAERVILAEGTQLEVNQVFFFQLVFGTSSNPWFMEFPYLLPIAEPTAITANFAAIASATSDGTVSISGEPFGTGVADFVWTAAFFDADDNLIYTTPVILGSESNFAIPANVLASGNSYFYQVTAQTLDRVPGYAAYTVKSVKTSFSMP